MREMVTSMITSLRQAGYKVTTEPPNKEENKQIWIRLANFDPQKECSNNYRKEIRLELHVFINDFLAIDEILTNIIQTVENNIPTNKRDFTFETAEINDEVVPCVVTLPCVWHDDIEVQ